MRRFFFCILWLFISFSAGASAYGDTVVAIQSIRIQPFEQAMQGFRKECTAEVKELFIADMTEAEMKARIAKMGPDVLLAVGTASLQKISSIKGIPKVYMMILNPDAMLAQSDPTGGVSIHVPYETQIDIFSKILPDMKTIGIVFHPDRSGSFVEKVKVAAEKRGIRVQPEAIYHAKDGPAKIKGLETRVDAFWMLPDISVITPETVDFLLMTSFRKKIPVLSFSDKYVKMGALAAVSMDPFDIGVQAGEMVNRVLGSGDVTALKRVDARKPVVSINNRIAEKFGIEIDETVRAGAKSFN